MHVAPVEGAAAVTGRWPQPSARRPAAAPGGMGPIGAAPPFGAVIFDLRIAGSIDIVTRVFAGVQVRADTLTFAPRLPAQLHRAGFGLQHRDHCIDVTPCNQITGRAATGNTADAVTQLTVASRALDRAGLNAEELERLLLFLALNPWRTTSLHRGDRQLCPSP
jgi:hypothetical protein